MYNDLDFDIPKSARQNMKFDPAPPGFARNFEDDLPPDEVDDYFDEYKDRFFTDHMQQYFGMVKCIDYNIGKVLDKLKNLGIEDDTVVVFTSDHGDMLMEHGRLNKNMPYESSAGIPFIVKYPDRVPKGKIIETPYSSVDFAPTILSLMGIRHLPAGVNFQGIDGSEELTSSELRSTNNNQIRFSYQTGKSPDWAMAVKNGYKLVLQKGDVPWLFDLDKDPEEMHNYASSWSHKDIFKELRDAMIPKLKEYKVPLTDVVDYIYLDMPSCVDSNDIMQTKSKKAEFCSDIGDSVPFSRCENQSKVRNHCPSSCNSCACEDSPGLLWVNLAAKSCDSLSNHCGNRKVQSFCPKTCGTC